MYNVKCTKRVFSPETTFYWKRNKNWLVSNIISWTNFVELIDILITLKVLTTLSTLKVWTALKVLSRVRYWKSENSFYRVNPNIFKWFLMIKCSWLTSKSFLLFYTLQDLNFLRVFLQQILFFSCTKSNIFWIRFSHVWQGT